MNNKLISRLTKGEILQLPGMSGKSRQTVRVLREQIQENMRRMNINRRAMRVNDYRSAFENEDRALFQNIQAQNQQHRQAHQRREQYKEYIRSNAKEEREFLSSINTSQLYQSKTDERLEYEQRVKEVQNETKFKDYMKEFMINANKKISFEVAIGDDDDKRMAFTESLRHMYQKNSANNKIISILEQFPKFKPLVF